MGEGQDKPRKLWAAIVAWCSLVLGLLSYALLGPLTSIPGYFLGRIALAAYEDDPDPPRASGIATAGLWLSKVNLVLCVLLVGAAIVIPNMMRRPRSNEGAPLGATRTLSTAQASFQAAGLLDANGDGVGDYATLDQLANPGSGSAPFIDQVLGSGVKHGYSFTVAVTYGTVTRDPGYTLTAVPSAPGKSGIKQFFVDESGVIRFTSDGSQATVHSDPVQ